MTADTNERYKLSIGLKSMSLVNLNRLQFSDATCTGQVFEKRNGFVSSLRSSDGSSDGVPRNSQDDEGMAATE
jgi:hypothetical protein